MISQKTRRTYLQNTHMKGPTWRTALKDRKLREEKKTHEPLSGIDLNLLTGKIS